MSAEYEAQGIIYVIEQLLHVGSVWNKQPCINILSPFSSSSSKYVSVNQ